MPFKLAIESRAVQQDVQSWGIPVLDMLAIVLDQVGADVVAYLRSYTNEWRPAVGSRGTSALSRVRDRKGGRKAHIVRAPGSGSGGKRRAHPGHWADITGDLMEKYAYKVVREPSGVRLEITNTSGHAIYVEAMDGFFVLKGITDKGGPLDQRLRAVLPLIAPTMKVV